MFHQFGLTTDDYTPKPAFHTMRDLIEQFSGSDYADGVAAK